MGIDIRCDECNEDILNDDSVVCLGCYEGLDKQLAEAEDHIKDLEANIESLEAEIRSLREEYE